MDSALHILSVCQCPVIRNMVIERHNIANRMILKVVSEGSYGSSLMHMDVGSRNHLGQHNVYINEQAYNRVIPPYIFGFSIPDRARCKCSRLDAILVTPCLTNPSRCASPSHRVVCSMRGNEEARSSATPARQLHKLNIHNRHAKPGAQLEASQQQHSELCKQLQGAETTLHTILLVVGGTN
eukprot:124815-Pelagomonas_calceolata.AAC.1